MEELQNILSECIASFVYEHPEFENCIINSAIEVENGWVRCTNIDIINIDINYE